MKKSLIPFITLILLFITFFASNTLSHPTKKTIELTINSTDAFVNGEKKTLEQAPIIMNQRTLVPLRFIGEEMGAQLIWDNAKQKITLTMDYAPYYKEKLSLHQAFEQIPAGNTAGNLANQADSVLYNDWIYTLFPFEKRNENGDFIDEWKIIRMRSDGSEVTQLRTLFNAEYLESIYPGMLNIVDDYLYFALKNENGASFDYAVSKPVKLYKAHLERNDTQVLFEGLFHSLMVYGDWIYLTVSEELSKDDPWEQQRHLYRIKTDGSRLELLLPESTYYPMVYQGYLYATIQSETECGIYRMLPDGSNRTKISNRLGAQIQGYGGWLYFIEYIAIDRPIYFAKGDIYRLRGDGTEENLVVKGKAYALNGSNDWIYFIDLEGLHRWNTIYGNLHQLHGECDGPILLFHDWVYFNEKAKNIETDAFSSVKMRTDGSNKQKIFSLP
jgi:hypothetical protein